MRVAADHFFADGFHHIFNVELVPVFRNFCVKQDLVKQVSQFVLDFLRIITVQGFECFVDFFDQIRFQAFTGLDLVPGAAIFSHEGVDNFCQFFKCGIVHFYQARNFKMTESARNIPFRDRAMRFWLRVISPSLSRGSITLP